MDIEQASQTEWNGGALTNMRIHAIREEIKLVAMNNDLSNWLTLLVQMNHEVYGFESKEEKEQIRNELKILANQINQYIRIRNFAKRNIGTPPEIIDALNDMQYQLDEIFHKSGLQTALKEDAGDSF